MTEVAPNQSKLVAMELKRNYRPIGDYEIVGWNRPAKIVKDGAGREVEAEPAAFVKGEAAPGPYPGVGFENKIWAGTTIRVSVDEAKAMQARKIAERGFDD